MTPPRRGGGKVTESACAALANVVSDFSRRDLASRGALALFGRCCPAERMAHYRIPLRRLKSLTTLASALAARSPSGFGLESGRRDKFLEKISRQPAEKGIALAVVNCEHLPTSFDFSRESTSLYPVFHRLVPSSCRRFPFGFWVSPVGCRVFRVGW